MPDILEGPPATAVDPPAVSVDGRSKTWFTSETAKAARQIQISGHPPAEPLSPFLTAQRDTMRARMEQVNEAMQAELNSDEVDAAAVDRLAAAWSKLAEQERILDGRPLPGSRRPAADSAAKLHFPGPME